MVMVLLMTSSQSSATMPAIILVTTSMYQCHITIFLSLSLSLSESNQIIPNSSVSTNTPAVAEARGGGAYY